MKTISAGVLCVVLCWTIPSPAEVVVPAAARETLKQYEDEAGEVEKKAEAELEKARERTIADLKKLQDELCRAVKLDEAIAVRAYINSVRHGSVQQDSEPQSARDLPLSARKIYRAYEETACTLARKVDADLDGIREKTTVELKKILEVYCKEAKLDEAVAVRELIRNFPDKVVTGLPDPGYINAPANDIGKVFYYEVTGAQPNVGSIYGTDIFTTGSHLGVAAVHRGLLKPGQKGVLKVTILPGQASYTASTQNGITSYAYGEWGVSFKVERGFGSFGRRK